VFDGLFSSHYASQARIPGTDSWIPISENENADAPEANENVAGVLIVRIRENLDFGKCDNLVMLHVIHARYSQYRTAQRLFSELYL